MKAYIIRLFANFVSPELIRSREIPRILCIFVPEKKMAIVLDEGTPRAFEWRSEPVTYELLQEVDIAERIVFIAIRCAEAHHLFKEERSRLENLMKGANSTTETQS